MIVEVRFQNAIPLKLEKDEMHEDADIAKGHNHDLHLKYVFFFFFFFLEPSILDLYLC